MCDTCGCNNADNIKIMMPGEEVSEPQGHQHSNEHGHNHSHDHHDHHEHHDHDHDHGHSHSQDHYHTSDGRTVTLNVERDVLQKNDLMAERNRGYFEGRNISAFNLVSSPGSGKTTLLEKTIKDLDESNFYIIEGDQQTMNDANRIAAAGAPVVQVNTGKGCHLDSEMIHNAIKKLDPKENAIVFIENVGNLVCPALFDLGESKRVVIMSVTEGEDKPLKYPTMFETSQLCILNKIDLLPYLNFDMDKALSYIQQINPTIQTIQVTATAEKGLESWYQWIEENCTVQTE